MKDTVIGEEFEYFSMSNDLVFKNPNIYNK